MIELVALGSAGEIELHTQALCSRPGISLRTECENQLDPNVIDGLVVLDIDDKLYWIDAALQAGIPVMASHPIGRLDGHRHDNKGGASPLCVMSQGKMSQSRKILEREMASIVRAPYYELALRWDSSVVAIKRSDSQAQAGLVACDLLGAIWGAVDELYGRTRNYFHGGPVEDWTMASLRMHNGSEGLLKIIDYPNAAAEITLNWYQADGLGIGSITLPITWQVEDLLAYYDNFVECIRDKVRPLVEWGDVVDSYRLLYWLRVAARADRVMHAREIKW